MEKLSRSITSGESKIAVYGLGLVGSAIAAVWLRYGATVIGVDKDESVVDRARQGRGPLGEPLVSEAFAEALKEGRFRVTNDGVSASKEARIKFVAVPVSWGPRGLEDSALVSALEDISLGLKPGDVVIVKPTVPIGTSRKLAVPLLSKSSGLKPDEEFLYVYSPERVSAGRAVLDIEEHYPAIVSGIGEKSLEFGKALYSLVARAGVIVMSSIEAAEAEKIFEGVYRDVNIALANELAKIAHSLNLDFEEVRSAANSQPYSHIHKPGLGVGGACIPVYPWFLVSNALEAGVVPELVLTARKINASMPVFFADLVERSANGVKGKKITVLGLAFRGNVADKRLSPTYDLVAELAKRGARITVHDPFFDGDETLESMSVKVTSNLGDALKDADIVVVATDHDVYSQLKEDDLVAYSGKEPVVVDSRRVLDPKLFQKLKLVQLAAKKPQ